MRIFEKVAAGGRAQLVKDGHLLSPAAMCERLSVTPQVLDKALEQGHLFTVDVGLPSGTLRPSTLRKN